MKTLSHFMARSLLHTQHTYSPPQFLPHLPPHLSDDRSLLSAYTAHATFSSPHLTFEDAMGTGRGKADNWGEWMSSASSTRVYEISAAEMEEWREKFCVALAAAPADVARPNGGYFTANDIAVGRIWCCVRLARWRLRKKTRSLNI